MPTIRSPLAPLDLSTRPTQPFSLRSGSILEVSCTMALSALDPFALSTKVYAKPELKTCLNVLGKAYIP